MMFDMKFAVTGADEPMVSKMDEIVFVMEVRRLGRSHPRTVNDTSP